MCLLKKHDFEQKITQTSTGVPIEADGKSKSANQHFWDVVLQFNSYSALNSFFH